MSTKSFLFAGSGIHPLKIVPFQVQRNAMEESVEYATSRKLSKSLNIMTLIDIILLHNKIIHIQQIYTNQSKKRQSNQTDANAYKYLQIHAPLCAYDIYNQYQNQYQNQNQIIVDDVVVCAREKVLHRGCLDYFWQIQNYFVTLRSFYT